MTDDDAGDLDEAGNRIEHAAPAIPWNKRPGVPERYQTVIGFGEMVATLTIEAELKRWTQERLRDPQLSELRKADVLDRAAEVVNKLLLDQIARKARR